jgi:carbamoyltransferase
MSKPHLFLGLGKVLYNSSVATLQIDEKKLITNIQILLTERLTRQKGSGAWPELALSKLLPQLKSHHLHIAENRDVITPQEKESVLNQKFPFYEHLKKKGLEQFCRDNNPEIEYLTHHYCHARAATLLSPYDKSLIIVMDGAGSASKDFSVDSPEARFFPAPPSAVEKDHEELSVYLQDRGELTCLDKRWQRFTKSTKHEKHYFSEGLGTLYEKSAEYIFNSNRAAGKVMGLSAFGRPENLKSRIQYLEELDWSRAFKGKSKADWEGSDQLEHYKNVAASIQQNFEERLTIFIEELKKQYPEVDNLILTGGCALNCTTNMKLVEKKIFKSLYIPPFPGDECIGLGCAAHTYYSTYPDAWEPWSFEKQNGYFGSETSSPEEDSIQEIFENFKIEKKENIVDFTAELLNQGCVVAWFQGRSESGPRALGNRSILARPDRDGLKEYLNTKIKFREAFRPYGCSCLFDKATEYFHIPEGFDNPYMSFTTKVKDNARELLKEVTHIDGTSRMQTVREGQNKLFYELIHKFGALSGLYCLLNTSLNIMGEPILETLEDARKFLEESQVDGMAIGDYFITKKGLNE